MHQPKIYAHRGASFDAPENTMAAFELAAQMGTDGFELDVILTKDGELVVIHDDAIERTSNGSGIVEEMYYSDLKQLDFGSWKAPEFKGESIPLLSDVCKLIKDKNLLLNIEIKPTKKSKEIEEKVISTCKSFGIVENVVVSSFNHYCLRSIKKQCKKIETAILYKSGIIKASSYARRVVKADGIHPHKYAITKECIKNAAINRIKIRPWTVDEVDFLKKIADIKYISGIITNRPDLMRKTLDERL